MKYPLISVAMANFNSADHLKKSIKSVLGQTFANFELILVDDCSSDSSRKIALMTLAEDPRMIFVASERNQGPAAARNKALSIARGDWVCVMDSDDVILPNRLRTLYDYCRDYNAVIAADNLIQFGQKEKFFAQRLLKIQKNEIVDAVQLVRNAQPFGYLKPFYRRDILGQVRYDERLRVGEDFDFLLRIVTVAGPLHILATPMYFYRRHQASITGTPQRTDLERMLLADDAYRQANDPKGKLLKACNSRRQEIVDAMAFFDLRGAVLVKGLRRALIASCERRKLLLQAIRHFIRTRLRRLNNYSRFEVQLDLQEVKNVVELAD
jgi:succinoglycan biosynthesis protein ExoO